MKKYLLLMLLIGQLAFETKIYSQNIAINVTGNSPDTSAMLDISSTNKGFLAPRMTTAQQNAIPLPANGLLIYNTTDNAFKVNSGTAASPVWTVLATGSGSISSLNGLSGTTQTFTTGNTGADFGIGSVGTTHTFNLPTASATARGALSSADWTTFNNKQAAVVSPNTTLKYWTGYKTFGSFYDSARAAISLTTTGASGVATYNSLTGVLNVPAYSSAIWLLGGNSGITQPAAPATYGTSPIGSTENFLGTEDAKDLVVGTSNKERMRILSSNGYLGIGTSTPSKPLDIVSSLPNVGLVKLQNKDATGYSSIDIWSSTTQIGNIGFSNSGAAYPNAFYFATNTTNSMVFATSNTERLRIDGNNGNIGVGVALPTAEFHLDAGTVSAGTAPLKFTSGTNLATPENGAVEFDGTNYFATSGGTRYTLAKTLTNTAILDFPSTGKQLNADLTITVTGAQLGDVVSLGVPFASVVTGSTFSAYVSAVNTVTVRYNNNGINTYDPASGMFRVSVIRY